MFTEKCRHGKVKIILAGKAGSGKDTVADYLASCYRFKRYAFADKLKEIARNLFPGQFKNKTKPRKLLQELGNQIRQLDSDVWVNYLFSRIERENPERAVIVDCRYQNELEVAVSCGFVPILVVCSDEIRQQRLIKRDGAGISAEDSAHISENDVFGSSLLSESFYVFNDDSLESLYSQLDEILKLLNLSTRLAITPPQPRLSWLETFMRVAETVAERSTCLRRKVGAVLVKDNRIVATGYNGAPKGLAHCVEGECLREGVSSGKDLTNCRAVHAEENCIIQAAVFGVSTVGSELYVTCYPCAHCAKTLVNAGVQAVYCREGYPDLLARDILHEAGVRDYILNNMPITHHL